MYTYTYLLVNLYFNVKSDELLLEFFSVKSKYLQVSVYVYSSINIDIHRYIDIDV